MANVYQALEINHEIIPVLNKIDLPASDIDKTKKEIEEVVGIETLNAILVLVKQARELTIYLKQLSTNYHPQRE